MKKIIYQPKKLRRAKEEVEKILSHKKEEGFFLRIIKKIFGK